ncbi:aldehyde dehydrogenase family protein [Halosimplex pelagicum]|uniref:Aldehyde dehydrogenase family protein n=1 Tax=Halosimplex pelagicum TaxID=869886 RepID=A0A7D5PCS6_9EURY|nr:aldehyde dehydrogenase family protein [Halosimplex pelagicum]QLH83645.1 aldehyde dehydrogenase family protein [Halosimplex pelagicum]
MTETTNLYIDGEWVPAEDGSTFAVENPADTTETVTEYAKGSTEDAQKGIDAANEAQADWEGMPAPDRGTILRETAKLLEERKEDLTEQLSREEGKTLSEASPEVQRAIDIFYYYAEKAADNAGTRKGPSGGRTSVYTKREALGVAGLVTPWNYPIAIPAWKIAPALATGNTIVLKPASAAPGPAASIVQALEDAGIPDGVINFVPGSGSDVGAELTSNDGIDAVSFTGSSEVGHHVYDAATDNMARAQAEMGGKNPAIITDSADVEEAVDIVGAGAFGVTGQACTACSRAIVHTDVYDEFVEGIVEYAESIDIGPGVEDLGMGPHVTQSELESTLEYVDVAANEGATHETGGERLEGDEYDDGYYVSPAVFSDVERDMRIFQEEVFGPVLAVTEVDDFEEAIEASNDSDFGLSSSVVTDDLNEAHEFIERTEAGVAKVNEKTTGLELHVPFGGKKDSSTNTYREQGDAGLDFFTEIKTVYLNT